MELIKIIELENKILELTEEFKKESDPLIYLDELKMFFMNNPKIKPEEIEIIKEIFSKLTDINYLIELFFFDYMIKNK